MDQFTDVSAPIAEQPAQEVAAQDTEVYAVDLLPAEAPKADAQVTPKPEVQTEKPKTKPAPTQAEIDHALSARLQDAERKVRTAIESSPDYLFGKNNINALAAKENITRDEAIKKLQREYDQQENQRLADNPLELIQKLKDTIAPKVDPNPEPQSDAQAPSFDQFKVDAQNLVGEAYKNGLLPDGYTVTPELIGFLYENRSNPLKLASYFAGLKPATPVENDADADVAQPRRTSAPIRTTSENARTVETDWRDKPDDDFKKILEQVKDQTRDGKRVII